MFKLFKNKREKPLDEDEELFSSLENDNIQLTEEQIHKAKNGDGQTLYHIGKIYDNNKNYSKALAWYRKGAVQNNSKAQTNIGVMYDHGKGVPKDYKQAMHWYLKAVNNDKNSYAQRNIGLLYQKGYGLPQDYKQAMDWFLKAVNKDGNKLAQNDIGILYYNGYGVPQNVHTAIDWFTKSANQGHSIAQYNLGWHYEYENEQVKDLQKAVNWYKKAADNDYEDASNALKRLNEQGYYPQDDEKGNLIAKYRSIEDDKSENGHQVLQTADKIKTKDGISNTETTPSSVDQEQIPLKNQTEEQTIKSMEEKMKKLEESFLLKLELLQQDKADKEILQQRLAVLEKNKIDKDDLLTKLDNTEKDKAKMEEEIKQLKEALAQARVAVDGDPSNDIYYDSSNQNSDNEDDNGSCDTEKEDDGDNDYQNDINYDSSSDDADCKNDPNYDLSDNKYTKQRLEL